MDSNVVSNCCDSLYFTLNGVTEDAVFLGTFKF